MMRCTGASPNPVPLMGARTIAADKRLEQVLTLFRRNSDRHLHTEPGAIRLRSAGLTLIQPLP